MYRQGVVSRSLLLLVLGLYKLPILYPAYQFVSWCELKCCTGQIYSVNDARYFDWPNGLRRYIDNVRQGRGQTRKQYSARYICSLVADLHRTILYGGIAMNPRSHLRLVYEANPLSYLVEQGGGRGTDGSRRILEISPYELHQRLPLFLGSAADVAELVSYGDVQQIKNPGYTV